MKIALCLAAALLAFSIAGCGSTKATEATSNLKQPSFIHDKSGAGIGVGGKHRAAHAFSFTTGNKPTVLSLVQIDFARYRDGVSVSLYSGFTTDLVGLIETLTLDGASKDEGVNTFVAKSPLLPNHTYWLYLTQENAAESSIHVTKSDDEDSGGKEAWNIGDDEYQYLSLYSDGKRKLDYVPMFAVYVTD